MYPRVFAVLLAVVLIGTSGVSKGESSPPLPLLICTGGALENGPGSSLAFVAEKISKGDKGDRSVCGWSRRAFRSNEPHALCFPSPELTKVETLGAGYGKTRNGVSLGLRTVFAILGSTSTCFKVGTVATYEPSMLFPTTLICHDVIMPETAVDPSEVTDEYEYHVAPGAPPASSLAAGSCFALGADPSALPPSRKLCIDSTFLPHGATHFDPGYPGTYKIEVRPWWPCGLASRVN